MQVDTLAVRLRPRTSDGSGGSRRPPLPVRRARSVYRCYVAVALPLFGLALATLEVSAWLPGLLIWCAQAVARSHDPLRPVARGLRPAHERWATSGGRSGRCGGGSCLFTWTVRRLSLWRSLTEPVYQLEGLIVRPGARPCSSDSAPQRRLRAADDVGVRHVRDGALDVALVSLVFWFAPPGQAPDILEVLRGEGQERFSV